MGYTVKIPVSKLETRVGNLYWNRGYLTGKFDRKLHLLKLKEFQ